MATLILSVVGSAIGGPVGGLIGAAIGQRIDTAVLGPKGRSGPRLSDLSVQTSSYGNSIPKLFGRMRMSGTVIWATDLVESRRKVSAGKGQPKTTVYSYTANFAVALSTRRAGRIGRIWADGKLLRGTAGDFKTPTGFRFYSGDDGQAVDPLIASVEGAGNCPAYRGHAYAVFEDFQLGDYGNRIPSLSFEVIADEADVSFGEILTGLAGDAIAANCPTLVGGFSATGERIRSVADTLSAVVPVYLRDDGIGLEAGEVATDIASVAANDLGADGTERIARDRASDTTLPRKRSLSFFDLDRDYQAGSQSARRNGSGQREERIELPASLLPDRARLLAERGLAASWDARNRATVHLPWRYLPVHPGMKLNVSGLPGDWTILSTRLEGMTLQCELTSTPARTLPLVAADAGRNTPEPDLLHGPTALHLIDVPMLRDGIATAPELYAVAAGTSSGWRTAALLLSLDTGSSWTEIGSTAASATMGMATAALAASDSWGIDRANSVDVDLLNAGMSLADADMAGLLAGKNLALLGQELIQFASAEPLGGLRWRLSGLLRGRRGTEWARADHMAGERFILLEADAMLPVSVASGAAEVRILASGVGDVTPVLAVCPATGAALVPPSPVQLTTLWAGQDQIFNWIRRSRDGWRWSDGADAPLVEETERYRIDLQFSNGAARNEDVSSAQWTYAHAARTADLASGATSVTLSIRQSGTFGASRPASLTFPL